MQLTLTQEQVEEAIERSFESLRHQCHAASLALVRSGLLGDEARVARGVCPGVGGQHSWAVIGDPYDEAATIVDITAWSYDERRPRVWITSISEGVHRPHGYGMIWQSGKPFHTGGETIELAHPANLSPSARQFLAMVEPLDHRGWGMLANSAVLGWPAREIIEAMLDTKGLGPLVPIDIVGMLTDRNPDGLYR